MGDGSYSIDYAAAERDVQELKKQINLLLIYAQKVEDHAATFLYDDGVVLWEDRLATDHYGLVKETVRGMRKLGDKLDEIAKGIEKTVKIYRAAEDGTLLTKMSRGEVSWES